MLSFKKILTDRYLHLALLLSFLRFSSDVSDNELWTSLDTIDNGTSWRAFQPISLLGHHHVHPKSLDSMLLHEYQSDIFERLNSLGHYNRYDVSPRNTVHTYLLTAVNNTQDVGAVLPALGEAPLIVEDGEAVASNRILQTEGASAAEVGDLGLTQEVSTN